MHRRNLVAGAMAAAAIVARAKSLLVAAVAILACLLGVADGANSADIASAKIIASSGFSPVRNGFSFANYGTGYANLSANAMRALFGSSVCAFTRSKRCVLTPPAQRYMENANRLMAGGHCFGMSALSLLLFRHQFPPLAGTPINRLRLRRDAQLQHAIAYVFQWQMLPAVQDAYVRGTPNVVLKFLTKSLRDRRGELYTMVIYKRGFKGGHAVTPYAVDDRGRGRYDALVYDNNWPDQVRRVQFDTHSNSWSYVAAVKRSAPAAVYRGNARTGTLGLLPTTPGLGVHSCPFCAGAVGRAKAYNEIQLQGNPYNHAHLLIRDTQSRALGYAGGKFVNQIPGARTVSPVAVSVWQQRQEPIYRLPFGVDVRVTVDGSPLRYPDTETFSLIGQNHHLAIDGIKIRPGERESITLVGGLQASMTYKSAGSQIRSPFFNVGFVRRPGNYSIGTQARSLHADSVITISDDAATSTLAIHDASASGQTFDFQLTQQIAGRVKKLRTASVDQPPGKAIHLLYGATVPAGQSRIQVVETGTRASQGTARTRGFESHPRRW